MHKINSQTMYLIRWIFFILLFSLISKYAFAEVNNNSNINIKLNILNQRLIDEQESYEISKKLYEQVDEQTKAIVDKVKNNSPNDLNAQNYILEQLKLQSSRISLYFDSVAVDRDSAEQDILSDENAIYQLENKLQSLLGIGSPNLLPSKQSLNSNIKELQDLMQYNRAVLKTNKDRLNILNKHYDLLKSTFKTTNQSTLDIQEIINEHIKNNQFILENQRESSLSQEIKYWLNIELAAKRELRVNEINEIANFADPSNISKYNNIQTKIIEAENNRGLLDLELSLLKLNARLFEIGKLLEFKDSNAELLKNKKNLAERITRAQKESTAIRALVNSRINLLNDNIAIINKEKGSDSISVAAYNMQADLLTKFNNKYNESVKKIDAIIKQLDLYASKLQELSIKDISMRQSLPYGISEWLSLVNDIILMPFLISKQALGAWLQFKSYFDSNTVFNLITLFLLQGVILGLVFLSYKYIKVYINFYENHRGSLSSSGLYIITRLLNHNKLLLAVMFNVYSLFWLASLSGAFSRLFLWFCAVVILIRVLIHVCYIFLIESVDEVSGDDRRLFNGLRYALMFGGVLAVLIVFGQELNLPSTTQVFVERLFMLFLLAVSYPLIINWQVVPQLIIDNLQPKTYVKKAIWLISLIVPVTILSNAALGIIGYINLAWKIAFAELQLSLVIALWLIFKGLFSELMEIVFRFFIRNVTNGWLWTESVLKPLHTVVNVLLFVFACIGLVFIYGWNRGVSLLQIVSGILSFPLISTSGLVIHTKNFLIFCIIFSFVIWATKWSREFSYRWIFQKTKDLGVRNSMSVFTQYSTLVVGIVIILRVLNVPLAELSVAIGGFVLFIGFGLRDILSNYASGIILLIERPIRVGDFVTIGLHEGKITKIGMRSITLESLDNLEVIVPNTDTITKSLTNWTFKDTIIRLELSVRIGYNENLDQIRELIYTAMSNNSEIVSEPPVQVYFKEFSETAVIAMVYFYIDFNKTPSRGAVRTAVMMEITRVFREHNISVAYPQQLVHVKQEK